MSALASKSSECSASCLYVAEFEKRVEELEKKNQELKEKFALKDEKIKRLHKKLRKYRNPHTPSSKRRGSSKSKSSRAGQEKRGRKKGYEGTTRSKPEPKQTIVVEEKTVASAALSSENPKRSNRGLSKIFPNPNRS